MRCFGYARTSVDDGLKVSVEAQLNQIKKETTKNDGGEPVLFFDKGKSGASLNREGLDQLKKCIGQSDELGVLYVWRYDRLFRKTKDALEWLDYCHNHQIEVISLSESLPQTHSLGIKRLMVQTLFILAEMQRNTIIENVQTGIQYKKSQGEYLASKVPFGYQLKKGKVIQKEGEAKVVRYIFDLYLSGKYGYRSLAKKMDEENYRCCGHSFQANDIHRILNNPIYCGWIKGGKTGSFKGNFQPIVSEEIFKQAESIRKSRQVKKQNDRVYLLRKKIVCPYCGRRLSPVWRWVQQGTKKSHHYYCTNSTCPKIRFLAEKLEENVINSIYQFIHQGEVFQEIVTAVTKEVTRLSQQKDRKENRQLKSKEQLLIQFENGNITLGELKRQLSAIEQEKKENIPTKTLKQCKDKLTKLLDLRHQTIQRLVLNEIDRVEVTEKKEIKGIYLKGLKENLIERCGKSKC